MALHEKLITRSNTVSCSFKTIYIDVNDAIIEKWHSELETCFLTLPDPLTIAQSLVGCGVGLGFYCLLRCRHKSRSYTSRENSNHRVECSNELLCYHLRWIAENSLEEGLSLKYLVDWEELLTVNIHFLRIREGGNNLLFTFGSQ